MKQKNLSLFDKAMIWAMDTSWMAKTGYSTPYLEELCRTFGLRTTVKLLGEMGKISEDLKSRFGEAEANAVLGLSGCWNGCRFCGVGHMLAANLIFFRDHDALFPISERDILSIEQQTYAETRVFLAERLGSREELATMAKLADRLVGLQVGESLEQSGLSREDDALVARALALWTVVGECSTTITYDLEAGAVPALDVIGKDKALRARYDEARAY